MDKDSVFNILLNILFIKKIFVLAVFFLMAIILLHPVSADIEINTYPVVKDFSIMPGIKNVDVCSCTEKSDVFTVSNSGSFAAIFYVSADSGMPGLRFSEESFELSAGESKDVIIYFGNECSTYKKDVKITVSSNLGVSKSFTKTISRNKCQNIELWMTGPDKSKSCQQASYLLFVRNIGSFAEQYRVYPAQKTFISSDYFELLPGQIAQLNATINIDCAESGVRETAFNIRSVKNKLDASISKNLEVASDYNYEVLIGKLFNNTAEVCNRVWETSIPITIINNGIDNEFSLIFEDLPSYARMDDPKTFYLKRGESKKIYLIINSHEFRSETEKQNIGLSVMPRYGSRIDQDIIIILKPCYEYSITIESERNSMENPLKSCSGTDYAYDFLVTNKGLYSENIALSLEGNPSGFILSQNSVKLLSGETKRLTLKFTGPQTNYLYDVSIVARLQNGIEERDNLWVQAYDKKSCYDVSLKDDAYKLNYDPQEITLRLQKKGITQEGIYDLSIVGIPFATLKDDIILMNDSYYDIKLGLDTYNISEGAYNGKLLIEELNSETSYTQDLTIILKDKSFFRKTFEFFFYGTQCRQGSFYEFIAIILVCIIIILFMTFGPHYPYKFWNRVRLKLPILIMLIIVFVVVAALSIFMFGMPKTEITYNLTNNMSGLSFDAVSGKEFRLDLSQFFRDPDNNSLRYSVSEMRHVQTDVKGSEALITPDTDFVGIRQFVVTAYDTDNESVDSPLMSLNVIPRKTLSPTEFYNKYCVYINLAFFAVLLILIFLAFIVKQKKRGRKTK